MKDSIRDTIKRHRLALELAVGKLELAHEAVLKLLKGMARELQEIERQEQGHGEALEDAEEKESATPKQLDYLKKLGVQAKEGLSKQEASALIDKALGKTRPEKEASDPEEPAQERLDVEVVKV